MRRIEVLLIEDNEGDIELMVSYLKDDRVNVIINQVHNGEEAMDYLLRRGKYETAVKPQIIFLDLNLPRKGGKEILAEIKNNQTIREIPIIIMTTSSSEKDMQQIYAAGGNAFITKPMSLIRFADMMRSLRDFWFHTVQL